MQAQGTFDIRMNAEPPFDIVDGVQLGRATFDKQFHGGLVATSQVHMLAARTAIPSSAGYVALERVTGSLDGRSGSFVLQHAGTMTRGQPTLSVTVVPDSATGQLAGLSGRMDIQIESGVHRYVFDYELA